MDDQKWLLRGIYYECCRANGNCPLTFGRDMVDGPCVNLATYRVTEGRIKGVDIKGAIYTIHADGIGPKFVDLFPGNKGIAEIAVYIDENAGAEQKEILESFLSKRLIAALSRKILGVKFVDIGIKQKNSQYIISTPYYEQIMTTTIGKDGQNPILIQNPIVPYLDNFRVYNGEWRYIDYGKNLLHTGRFSRGSIGSCFKYPGEG